MAGILGGRGGDVVARVGFGVEHLRVVVVGRHQRPDVGGGVDGDVQQRRAVDGEQRVQRIAHAIGAIDMQRLHAERRGFQPVSVDGEAQPDGDRWHLRMTVEGEREPDNLRAQLAKLYDCLAVEVSPCR